MSKYISQYDEVVSSDSTDYYLLQRGTSYKKFTKANFFNQISNELGIGVSTLVGLTDVDITYLSNGDTISYNSATETFEFVPISGGGASDLADLGDVTITGLATNDVIAWNGSAYVNDATYARVSSVTTGFIPRSTGSNTFTNGTMTDDGSSVGFNTATYTYSFSFGGNTTRSLGMVRHTTANTAGNTFSTYAGGATSGASDKNGGNYNIYTGIATGTGTSQFNVYTSPAGSTGTTDNTQTLKMTINGRGETGFGVASPTAVVHLKAGTSTSGTAPLKFNSGTNLATPEAGAIEFNGTELYFTPNTSRLTLLSNRGGALSIISGKDVANTTFTGNSNIIFGHTLGQGLTTGADNVLIGRGAGTSLVDGGGNVTIGSGIQLSNSNGVVAIGRYVALATGTSSQSIYIGDSVNFAGTASSGTVVMIGASATISSTGSAASSMCLGTNSNITATKQCVIGSDNTSSMFTEMIIFGSEGTRSDRSTPLTMVLRLPSMYSGTATANLDGHIFDIKGSASSGSGGGGDIRLHTTNSAGSGTAINTYTQRLVLKGVTGYIGLQGITTPTAFLHLAATTTAAATLNIPQGTAPTSPNDGDLWREDNTNTGLKIRVNGVTKTITLS